MSIFFLVCFMLRKRPGAMKAKAAARKVAYLQRRLPYIVTATISKLLGGLNCHEKHKKTKAYFVLFKNTIIALLPLLLPQVDFKVKGSLCKQTADYKIFEEFSYEPLLVI